VLRHNRNETEIEYFFGDDLSDFAGKVFGLFRGVQYFAVRDFYYEPHTASLPAFEEEKAGCLQQPPASGS